MDVKLAIDKRYSTRYYDKNKKISNEDMLTILEAGRKAPNGLGLELWQFIVVDGNKEDLKKAGMNQDHIGTSSHCIVFTHPKSNYLKNNPSIIRDKLKNNGLDEQSIKGYLEYLNANLGDSYHREQTFFAASQMCLQATELGIGTVLIGGFIEDEVAKIINLDQEKYSISLMLSLGYSTDKEPKKRYNRPMEEMVKLITL